MSHLLLIDLFGQYCYLVSSIQTEEFVMSQEVTKEMRTKMRYIEASLTASGASASSAHILTDEGVYFPSKADPLGDTVLNTFTDALIDLLCKVGQQVINAEQKKVAVSKSLGKCDVCKEKEAKFFYGNTSVAYCGSAECSRQMDI